MLRSRLRLMSFRNRLVLLAASAVAVAVVIASSSWSSAISCAGTWTISFAI
jgi:hypothetical protein